MHRIRFCPAYTMAETIYHGYAYYNECLGRLQVWFMELVGIAPKGSVRVSSFLETAADGLVEGGK